MKIFQDKKIDLGTAKVRSLFWHYAIPSIIAMIVQSTAGLVDSIFIGRYVGPEGLSAITLVMPLIFLLAGVGMMIAIGGSTLAGIHKGKGEEGKSINLFNVTWAMLTLIALSASGIILLTSVVIRTYARFEESSLGLMLDYGETLSYFFLPFLLTSAFSFFLKLDGKPVAVVVCMLVGTGINIIFDFLFVGVLGWGVKGAAIATGASQLIPWLILTYFLIYKSSWKFRKPVFRLKEIGALLFNGSSELLSIAALSIAGFIFNGIIIAKIGMNGVAAYAVAMQVAQLASALFYGFAEAIQSSVSFNLGAEQLKRVKKLKWFSVKANFCTGILVCVISIVFGKEIASLFVKEPEIMDAAAHILKFYAVAFLLSGVNITLATYYTSVNAPLLSGILAMMRSLIGVVSGIIILPFIFGDEGIWMALVFAEVITIILGIYYSKKCPYGPKKDNIMQ